MDSKGIFNIEILISLMFLIIIFSLLLSLSITEFTAIDETQNRKESRIITNDISEIINKVYQNENGYSIQYKLPSKINKETYILKINNTGVYINSHYQLTYSNLLPNHILKQNNYQLDAGNVYTFTKNNNTVDITKN